MLSLLGFLKGFCWNSYEFLMLLCVSFIIPPSNLLGNELPAGDFRLRRQCVDIHVAPVPSPMRQLSLGENWRNWPLAGDLACEKEDGEILMDLRLWQRS